MTVGPPQPSGRTVVIAAVTAAVMTGLFYLLYRFGHDDIGWVGVVISFVLLFFFYLGMPWIGPRLRRFFRGP